MNILAQGTKGFSGYEIVVRAMGVGLSGVQIGGELAVYSLGPYTLNAHLTEFFNKTEASLKQRGIRTKLQMIPLSGLDHSKFDSLYFFCNNKERVSKQVQEFEKLGKEVLVFRY